MSLLSEAQKLVDQLEKIKESLGLNKPTGSGSIFSAMEVRKGSIALDSNPDSIKQLMSKPKKYYFRITYLKDSIQFLDIKSILNLCLVNKEFNYFIKSIYFYKFMSDARNSKIKKKKPGKKENEKVASDNVANSGIFGNFVGALGSVFGLSAKKENKMERKIDPKLMEEKLNLHEKILKVKLKNAKLSSHLKDKREQIDSLILSRKVSNMKKDSSNMISSNLNFPQILKDEEIEQIKRDKLEKEYSELVTEVEALKLESAKLKEEIAELQKNELETEKTLTSINTYIKNNMKIEDIKITPKEKLKSNKHGDVDGDILTMALFNSYIDK